MKRQRGRGRKPGGGNGGGGGGGGHFQPNRTLESNGPDIKVRGPASHIYERYLQLARDASSAGDRVMAENYSQHAEHYFRMLRAMQPAAPPPTQHDRYNSDSEYDDGEDEGSEGGEGEQAQASGGEPQAEGEFAQQGGQDDRDGFRRRRGRRNRFRPDGERDDQAPREGGERAAFEGGPEQRSERHERPERAERPERVERPERSEPRPERAERPERSAEPRAERPERQPRERRPRSVEAQGENTEGGNAGPGEGFAVGPRPAFLGSD